MEPALDVLDRALQGDDGALAFLERTSSIYVLDVTDQANPKTYGCWNFIHQALNEIERKDAVEAATPSSADNSDLLQESLLVHHVRLLASIAHRVARRSPQEDRAIVATCIANASDYHCSPSQSQWLFDLNLELREIVMGRIAAMAFDFTFHEQSATNHLLHQHKQQEGPPKGIYKSAFADLLVLDTFCAILAANAVISGEIKNFATEWIIPSSRSIPVGALVSVANHLSLEGMRIEAPVGTMDDLQSLSVSICSMVLVPVMADAVAGGHGIRSEQPGVPQHHESGMARPSSRVETYVSNILANSLRALQAWCMATTLTLPQVKHIASKVNLDFMEILSDVISSDSVQAVDALADYVEQVTEETQSGKFSIDRMNQVRHILQVSELAFHANFGAEQLHIIEHKEMGAILDQLVSKIGLQRVRFIEQQNQGNLSTCHNMARIARALTGAWLDLDRADREESTERSIMEFLLKIAEHPSIHVSGTILEILPRFFPRKSQPVKDTIPLLQRKVIIPHIAKSGSGETKAVALDDFGVSLDQFLKLREHGIADALKACWAFESKAYIDSCSSAIMEFCGSRNGKSLSFHLEAALFCMEVIGPVVKETKAHFSFESQLLRCLKIVSQPSSFPILENPLTASRLCSLLRNWSFWFDNEEKMDLAIELISHTLSTMLPCLDEHRQQMLQDELDCEPLPIQQSALAFEALVTNGASKVRCFKRSKIVAMLDLWKISYAASKQRGQPVYTTLTTFGKSLCLVVLGGPEEFQAKDLDSILAPCIESIRSCSSSLRDGDMKHKMQSDLFCDDLKVLDVIVRACRTPRGTIDDMAIDDGDEPQMIPEVPGPLDEKLYNLWTNVRLCSECLGDSQESICVFSSLCSSMISSSIESTADLLHLKDLGGIVIDQLNSTQADSRVFECVCNFLKNWAVLHHHAIEQCSPSTEAAIHMRNTFKRYLTQVILKARTLLPASGTEIKEQLHGQDAFETRSSLPKKIQHNRLFFLGPILALFRVLLARSPLFFAEMEVASENLLQQAIAFAAFTLGATESTQLPAAIDFLQQVTKQGRHCQHENIRLLLLENLKRTREDVVARLLCGFCGSYNRSCLELASMLFFSLGNLFPTAEIESDCLFALQKDFFHLGETGQKKTLSIITDCLRGRTSLERFSEYIERIWELHRGGNGFYLPNSDAVARLLRNYDE